MRPLGVDAALCLATAPNRPFPGVNWPHGDRPPGTKDRLTILARGVQASEAVARLPTGPSRARRPCCLRSRPVLGSRADPIVVRSGRGARSRGVQGCGEVLEFTLLGLQQEQQSLVPDAVHAGVGVLFEVGREGVEQSGRSVARV